MSHTPGPWVVEDSRKLKKKKLRQNLLMVVAEHGGMPGLIVNQGAITPTDEHNARLIAAAPELLELLEAIHKTWALHGIAPELEARIVGAIKKARGE
jgi:hypothetical protein